MTWEDVPGYVSVTEALGETNVMVEADRLVEAAMHMRDEEGFNFLADLTPADYLGWGEPGVSGYIGTDGGRDLNYPMTRGFQRLPGPKPKRFSVSYHLLRLKTRVPHTGRPVSSDGRMAKPSVLMAAPQAAPRARARAASACRSGSISTSRSRASSPCGRRPTGSSARPGT